MSKAASEAVLPHHKALSTRQLNPTGS